MTTPTMIHTAQPRRRLRVTPRPALTSSLFLVFATGGLALIHASGHDRFAWYGATLGTLLFVKMLLSVVPPRDWGDPDPYLTVGVVVPIFNEDPVGLQACLDSIDRQTVQPGIVILVDDCSTDRRASHLAEMWASERPHARYVGLVRNVGKRHAQAQAFARYYPDIWVTVDSDTRLEPDAIWQGLRPFNDSRVTAASGTVLALNALDGILPGLIDLRYANAFLGERAAQSRLGSVLCCCGSLSFWRASVIRENLDDWLSQTFLGQPATFGDDRRLTRYALDAGLVVLARDSLASTAVPVSISHYLRQQARWGRSFWRESYLMIRHGSPRRLAWWLTGLEVTTTILFSFGMIAALVVAPFAGHWASFLGYIGWVAVSAWARSVHAFVVRGRHSVWRTALAFLSAPLYGFMSLFVLLPLRFWSLCTLKSSNWGTRGSGVEVEMGAVTTRPQACHARYGKHYDASLPSFVRL